MDHEPLCHCGAAPLAGWSDKAPGWPLCADHTDVEVFVYGTLKQAYGNYRVVSDLCVGVATGTVDGFGLVDLGSFPGAVVGEGKVRGEVLTLTDAALALQRLDALEGVPNLYTREEVTVALDDGTERTVFMYVLASSASSRRWSSGEVPQDENGVADWHPTRKRW